MALAPRFAGQKLALSSTPSKTPHTIELYLDYVCPFSAKMFKTLHASVLPTARTRPYAPNVQFLFRQQIQPWHPSSTLVHESAVAVLKLAPDLFWEYSGRLFERQADYFDVNVVGKGRNETYRMLAELGEGVGVDGGRMYGLLEVPDRAGRDGGLNVGNGVTEDLKVLVKMARLTGVHVSPTVIFNGVVENGISSSFSPEQWDEWLTKNCT